MRMVIIGAGASGAMASGAFGSFSIQVREAKKECHSGLADHTAIMRVRDPRVALLLGCGLESITVQKEVLWEGELHQSATISMNNAYSIKTSGTIGNKSVLSLGSFDRHLINGVIRPRTGDVVYGSRLVAVRPGTLLFTNADGKSEHVDYDVAISTVPMPILLRMANLVGTSHCIFSWKSIYTTRIMYQITSTVNQTIYLPELELLSYRATLQKNELIIESIEPIHGTNELEMIEELFGINGQDKGKHVLSEMQAGKLAPIDEAVRKRTLHELTSKYNIFSLGRYAIWKPIRMDEVVKDIEWISEFIHSGVSGYNVNKGATR